MSAQEVPRLVLVQSGREHYRQPVETSCHYLSVRKCAQAKAKPVAGSEQRVPPTYAGAHLVPLGDKQDRPGLV